MTKARDIADFKFEDIVDTGTEGTKVATGTTAQRGSTQGQIRFNTTTGLAEYYDGSSFRSIDSPPIVSSINTTNFESSALPTNVVITGNNFATSVSVKFIGNDGTETSAGTTTRDSSSQITAQIPNTITSANEPYDVKVTNTTSNLAGTLADAFNIDAAPAFSVASGSLGTLQDSDRAGSNLTTVAATDDEGDSITFSVTSGSIPTGLTFNSDGTFSGTANAVSSNTTSTFTVTASDGTNTSTRQYTVTVNAPEVSGGTTQDYTINGVNYRSHTFLSSGTLIVNTGKTVDYMIVGGGGGGGSHNIDSSTGGGGGGAGGFRTFTSVSLSPASYTATVGQGGSGGTSGSTSPSNGGDTTFNSQTATGGGRGGARNQTNANDSSTKFNAASNGGSGGGAGYDYPNNAGSGNTPSTNPSQGNNGGIGYGDGSSGGSGYSGGGGGGAGSAGGNHSGGNAGNGGSGSQNNYRTGSNQYYAAGGGGGAGAGSSRGTGGSSIGGSGANDSNNSTSPTQNTGSGGGGCGGSSNAYNATSGADGIIVIRYQI